MSFIKKSASLLLAVVCMCSMATSALAVGTTAPVVQAPTGITIQPRFDNIHLAECSLDVYTDGTAYVYAWVNFVADNECRFSVKLEHNGVAIRQWVKYSSTGRASFSKDVADLVPGVYQAVMNVTCGTDELEHKSTAYRL